MVKKSWANPATDKTYYLKRMTAKDHLNRALMLYDGRWFCKDTSILQPPPIFVKKLIFDNCSVFLGLSYYDFMKKFKHEDCTNDKLLNYFEIEKKSKILAGLEVCHASVMACIEQSKIKKFDLVLPMVGIADKKYFFMANVGEMVAQTLSCAVNTHFYTSSAKRPIRYIKTYNRKSFLKKHLTFSASFIENLQSLPKGANILILQDVCETGAQFEAVAEKIKRLVEFDIKIVGVGISHIPKNQLKEK